VLSGEISDGEDSSDEMVKTRRVKFKVRALMFGDPPPIWHSSAGPERPRTQNCSFRKIPNNTSINNKIDPHAWRCLCQCTSSTVLFWLSLPTIEDATPSSMWGFDSQKKKNRGPSSSWSRGCFCMQLALLSVCLSLPAYIYSVHDANHNFERF